MSTVKLSSILAIITVAGGFVGSSIGGAFMVGGMKTQVDNNTEHIRQLQQDEKQIISRVGKLEGKVK